MENWKCPDCGTTINKSLTVCSCGYNDNAHYFPPSEKMDASSNNNKEETVGFSRKKVLLKIVKLVVLIHLIGYAVLVGKQTAGRPHFVGKAFMLGAFGITKFYIVPLSKMLGPYNMATKPFYFVRDSLYDLGWKVLPDYDAERYMWWYAIRYTTEYYELVGQEIYPYAKGEKQYLTAAHFDEWTNELFNHIEPLARLPLKDKFFQQKRFWCFVNVASRYVTDRSNFLGGYHANPNFLYESDEEIKRIGFIFKCYVGLKKYAYNNENKAYREVFTEGEFSWLSTNWFVGEITATIIFNSVNLHEEKIYCDSELIIENINSRKAIMKYALGEMQVPPLNKRKVIERYENDGLHEFVYHKISEKCTGAFGEM